MNVFSFSLYGNNPIYLIGVVKNLEIINYLFPDWKTIISYADNVDKNIITELRDKGAILIEKDHKFSFTGMFWRFLPICDTSVDVMISRDCDSRLCMREKYAVDDWISSGNGFHIMRDHPHHGYHILGGMWGCRNGIMREINLSNKIKEWNKFNVKLFSILKEVLFLEYDEENSFICFSPLA